jgi:hypothetical protein
MAMPDSEQERCRQEVDQCERRYRHMVRLHTEAVASGADEVTVAAAAELRDAAREEFGRALRVFSDLVVRGQQPKRGKD